MIWVSLFFQAQSADLQEILEEINDLGQHVFQAQSADLLEILMEINDLGQPVFLNLNQPTCWKYSRKSMIWVCLVFKSQSPTCWKYLKKSMIWVSLFFKSAISRLARITRGNR